MLLPYSIAQLFVNVIKKLAPHFVPNYLLLLSTYFVSITSSRATTSTKWPGKHQQSDCKLY